MAAMLSKGFENRTIKNDSKAVKILADMTGLTEDEMKELAKAANRDTSIA